MTGKIGSIAAAALAVPAVAVIAAVVSAQESGPTVVTGATLTCTNGAQVQKIFLYDLHGICRAALDLCQAFVEIGIRFKCVTIFILNRLHSNRYGPDFIIHVMQQIR